jgi:hypothetical protein
MRSLKLVSALAAAAATSLALLTAGVSAAPPARHAKHRQAIRNGSCRLSLLAAPRFVLAGEATTLRGTLVCGRAPVSGQTVTVLERSAGSPGLTIAGTPTTDSSGFFELASAPLTTNSTFYATVAAAHSAHRAVKVMPKVTLASPADGTQLFTGAGPFKTRGAGHSSRSVVRFTGTVSPSDAGAIVVLQRENAVGVEEWHRIAEGVVDRNGNYSIAHRFGMPGDANMRVVVRPSDKNAIGASEAFSYEISQPQNPALLIEGSANPLIYGQSLTISGRTAAGPGATVTLLARTRAQGAFAPVATMVSGPGGTYSFNQTPLQNTLYRVTSGATSSATMFEGVKYLLTPAPTASSVQVGQPLTVSGKATPAVAGHPIYLQILNPAGIGYHVVQTGIVDALGDYSITHVFFNATISPRTLRVKIPGDPQNQGAAGQPFQVSLTPAPAPLLRAEPPANSSQPHEGQV